MENVDNVAAAFIELLGPLQTRKLQKLVYYSQAWHAAGGRGALFEDQIEAWVDGPVVRRLWDRHSYQAMVDSWADGDPQCLSDESFELVQAIVAKYGHLTGDELSALTHVETPWVEAREGLEANQRSDRPISIAKMADYYGNQVLAPAAAATHALANAAIEGFTIPEGLEELLVNVAAGEVDADSAIAKFLAQPAYLR